MSKKQTKRDVFYQLSKNKVRVSVKTTYPDGSISDNHILTARKLVNGVVFETYVLNKELHMLVGKLEGLYPSKLSEFATMLEGLNSTTRLAKSTDGSLVEYKAIAGVGSKKQYKLPGSKFAQSHATAQDAKIACLKFLQSEHPDNADALMMRVLTEGFEIELTKELSKDELLPVWQILGEDQPVTIEVETSDEG